MGADETGTPPSCPCDHPPGWHFSWSELAGITLVMAFIILVALAGCAQSPKPAPAPVRPKTVAPSVVPHVQVRPGGYCATSKLGKSFVKDGLRYVCKGPKPYRWRLA